jgi:iron complex transport system substrate-binding protein
MRIVSLLPAATEILYAIGAGPSVVGVTHECDFPPAVAGTPAVIRSRVDPSADQAEIDRRVRALIERGESIYAVDAQLLETLAPALIVTQDLCHVCAASPEDLAAALARLPETLRPRVVTFTPRNLADVWQGIRVIGDAAGHAAEADALAARLARRVAEIAASVADVTRRPRVLCLEWFDPPFFGGHWVPEMVRLAGGIDVLGREGEPSVTVTWPKILATQPEVIVLMPCGYALARNLEIWRSTRLPAGWDELPAVKTSRVYAVDGNGYFSRCGPRLADGVALLASLFHPERFEADAVRALSDGVVHAVKHVVGAANPAPRRLVAN